MNSDESDPGATPWGALGGHSTLLEPGAPPQMKRELQWKNWLTRDSLLAVKLWLWTVMALSLFSLLCSVNEHYILLIIRRHRLRSGVYTLQVNNSKQSNLFAYLITAQQLIWFIAEFGKSSRRLQVS